MHRSCFAPYNQQKFDLNGFPDYGHKPTSSGINSHTDSSQHTSDRPPRSWVEAIAQSASLTRHSSSSGGADCSHTGSSNSV